MTKRSKFCVNKFCGVCGDNAIGRNFGEITCESCKAFFRRAALKTKTLKCNFENNCIINAKNRKSCKKCRLDKCFTIGMRKELIKKEETELTDSKRFGRKPNRNHENNDSSASFENLNPTIDSICNPSPERTTFIPHEQSSHITTDQSFFKEDFLNDFFIETSCLNEEDIESEIKDIEKYLMSSESNVESEVMSTSLVPIVRPIATFDKEFNDIELNRMTELMIASNSVRVLVNNSTKYYIQLNDLEQMFSLFSLHKIWDKAIEETMKFCKNISTFKEICESDQIVLFKNSYMDIVSLTNLPYYNQKEEYWQYTINSEYSFRCHLNMLRLANEQTYYLCKNFFHNFPDEWKADTNLINLMMAIALFSSDTSKLNLIHKPLVKLHQQMYLYLLQRYLVQKFRSENEYSENLSKSLKTLMELHILAETQKGHTRDYSRFLSPLVKETFGL